MNPEFRQTLNTLSHNFETANQTAQENIYTFTQLYIDPCLTGLKSCLQDCTGPCISGREGTLRRKRGRSRGRAELDFDFYDDWDDEQDAGNSTMAWGDDELDSLLAGRRAVTGQPRRPRAMSYGARGRRKLGSIPGDTEQDPTVIPSSSYLGFLERLPWKIGAKVLRYRPSAADLQVNPGGLRVRDEEVQPLMEESDEAPAPRKGHGRQRSGTATSRSTTNSLSSRGDLIMSDEEDDAVPLGDEFAVMLSRRTTNTDDHNSGKTGSNKRPGASRRSTRAPSSKSRQSSNRSSSQKSRGPISPTTEHAPDPPTMQELHQEEEQVKKAEEGEIEQKREAAQRLAMSRGLNSSKLQSATAEVKQDSGENAPSLVVIPPRPSTPDNSKVTPKSTGHTTPVEVDPPLTSPQTEPP